MSTARALGNYDDRTGSDYERDVMAKQAATGRGHTFTACAGITRESVERLRNIIGGLREARVRLQEVLSPEPRPVSGTNALRDAPPGGLASIGPDLRSLCDELESEVKQLHSIA